MCANGICRTNQGTVTVVSPNGGEVWKIGETHAITWSSTNFSPTEAAQISLYDDSTNSSILVAHTTNSGFYSWTIPANLGSRPLGNGNVYKIAIFVGTNNPGIAHDESDSNFSIIPQTPPLTASCNASPNPGLTNQPITFTAMPTGGTGNYSYTWSGVCNGGNPSCMTSFPTQGNKIAFLTVTSGSQTVYTSCSTTINPSCTFTGNKVCQGDAVYNVDSCGNRTLDQTCSQNQICQQNGNTATCVNQTITCSQNSQCGTNGYTGSPVCQNGNVWQNFTTYTCQNPGTPNSRCDTNTQSQLKTTCGQNQTCSNGSCVTRPQCSDGIDNDNDGATDYPADFSCGSATDNDEMFPKAQCQDGFDNDGDGLIDYPQDIGCTSNQDNSEFNASIVCSSNSQCGTNTLVGNPFCQGGNVYQNFKTFTCNNAGTTNSSCSNSTQSQLQLTCTGNQTCNNGSCSAVICSSDIQCGPTGPTGSPFCQNGNVYQNYTTNTCQNPGMVNSRCNTNTQPQLQTTCTGNQTCNGGVCVTNPNPLAVSCTSQPNPASTGQPVLFTGVVTGGNGGYAYQWSGACPFGISQNCTNTFQSAGNYYAFLTVTSGSESKSASCPAVVSRTCTPNASKRCVGDAVYNVDSCGNQTLDHNCNSNQTCNNGTCIDNLTALTVSCTPQPSSVSTGQQMAFTGLATGGAGNYSYQWSGACPFGIASNCNTSFTNPGNYIAFLTVTSGSEAKSTSCSVQVNQVCTATQNKVCQGNAVYNVDSCGNKTLDQTCNSNQTCNNGSCQNQNIICNTNSDCGINGYTGNPSCQGGHVWQNYTTHTCQNPGTANSRCNTNTQPQLQTTCSQGQTCMNGTCTSTPEALIVHCAAQPSTALTNQQVSFTGIATGGSGHYTYQWSGGCPFGNGQNCTAAFSSPGNYVSFLTVTSGSEARSTSCMATINPSCTQNATQRCEGSAVYSYDSCGNRGSLVQQCSQNQTCSNGSCQNQNIICSSDSQCGTNGYSASPFCQSGNVYQNYTTYTCQNPGTSNSRCDTNTQPQLKNTCSSNQTCANGSCSAVACSTNSDCGSNSVTGGLFCQGNAVYQNYRTYTCQNPGTTNAQCTNTTNAQLQTTCSGNQTCQGSSCVSSCTPRSTQRCVGSAVYWFDSCGVQQELSQACTGNQTCQNNTCVNQGGLFVIVKEVRNLSSGNLNWGTTTAAVPGDTLQFRISVSINSNQTVNNVMIRDTLSYNLIYRNQVTLDGVAISGDVIAGINIGSIAPGQTRVITYYTQVTQ